MTFLPNYTHIVNRKLKHTYLTFDAEGNLIIKSPKVSQKYIEILLLKKSAWITRSQKKILQKKGQMLSFEENSRLYYLGTAFPLVLEKSSRKRVSFSFTNASFLLSYSDYNESLFQKHIQTFYRNKAEEQIPLLVEKWSQIMGLTYNALSFRKTKRQWGSCSAKNNLSFNTMMMKLPPDVIEYIVVHELAHIEHKHHQKDFWECVRTYLPDYKNRIKILKTFTT